MAKYLNETGLQTFWNKIKSNFIKGASSSAHKITLTKGDDTTSDVSVKGMATTALVSNPNTANKFIKFATLTTASAKTCWSGAWLFYPQEVTGGNSPFILTAEIRANAGVGHYECVMRQTCIDITYTMGTCYLRTEDGLTWNLYISCDANQWSSYYAISQLGLNGAAAISYSNTGSTTIPDGAGGAFTANKIKYVAANTAITAGTATKVTYNTAGLVTSGEDATLNDLAPLATASYTGLTSTANNSGGSGCDFILGEFNVDTTSGVNWILDVELEAKYTASDWSNNLATSNHICHVEGFLNSTICSSMWNNFRTTSYRPFYYFVIYCPSTSSNKFYFGVCMYNCNRNITTDGTNLRSIKVNVRSTKYISNLKLHDSTANTDYATYYKSMAGRSAYDICNNGLRESGDDNSTVDLFARDVIAYTGTAAGTADKAASMGQFVYKTGSVTRLYLATANTASSKLRLQINGQGYKDIYLLTASDTWTVTSSTNKTMAAGAWQCYYNGTNWYCLGTVNASGITNDNAMLIGQASYATKNVFVDGFKLVPGARFRMYVYAANTSATALNLNVNLTGAKTVFINNTATSTSAYTLNVGWYDVMYDGTNYHVNSTAGINYWRPVSANGEQKLSNYAGTTLNFANGTNTTVSYETGGTFKINASDTKVTQTAKSDNVAYPLLAAASASPTSGSASTAVYDTGVTLNPSTNTIAANISGDAATASAAKANSTLATTIAGKVTANTAITGATKCKITYDSKGLVTKGEDLLATDLPTHSHGFLGGTVAHPSGILGGATNVSSGYIIAVCDAVTENDYKGGYLRRSTIEFDGTTTNKALTPAGTWETFMQSNSVLTIGTKTYDGSAAVTVSASDLGISATTSSVTVGTVTFNKYTHPTGAGNNHVPAGGSSGQVLGWDSAGTAKWVNNPNTDEKLKTVAQNPTSITNYAVPFRSTTAGTTTAYQNDGIYYRTLEGTASAVGYGILMLGNGTGSGTAGNKEGRLYLYSPSTARHIIRGNAITADTEHVLPTTGGTVLNSGTTKVENAATAGTKVADLTINGTKTTLYAPTNTNYYPTAFTWTNGTTAGPTGSLTGTGTGMTAVSFGAIPAASATVSGIVTTAAQTLAGSKTVQSADPGVIVVKRTNETGGAFIDYYNRNQSTNYWRLGMNADGYLAAHPNGSGTAVMTLDSTGNLTAVKQVKGETLNVNSKVTMQYNTTNSALDFVFA